MYISKVKKINFYHQEITKFKTVKIKFIFEENAADVDYLSRKILTRMLVDRTARYPSKKDVAKELVNLYGADISFTSQILGQAVLSTIELTFLSPKYVKEHDYLERVISFFKEVLFNPLLSEGKLSKDLFEEVKRRTLSGVLALNSSLQSMAEIAFERVLFQGRDYGDDVVTDVVEVDKVTLDDVCSSYDKLLSSSLYVAVVGDIKIVDIQELMVNLPLETKGITSEYIDRRVLVKNEMNVVSSNLGQTNLYMGFSFPVYKGDSDFYKARIFTSMFGGEFHSKLVQVVREELGLAYSIHSRFLATQGVMIVKCGLSGANFEQGIAKVLEILEEFKSGSVTEELLERSKKTYLSKALSSLDYHQEYFNQIVDTYSKLRDSKSKTITHIVNDITIEDIADVAKKMDITYIHVLRGN